MRKPRNRSQRRKERPHDKNCYNNCATLIQKAYRKYISNRYANICRNHEDDDLFTLIPVVNIPRDLLVIYDNHAFHAYYLLKWLIKTSKHPLSREIVGPHVKKECVEKITFFLNNQYYGKRKGYHSEKKTYKKEIKRYYRKK